MIEFFMAVKKRLILIIFITIIGTISALYLAFSGERSYEGQVTLLIYQDEDSDIVGLFKSKLGFLGGGPSYDISEILNSIIKSDIIADRVIEKLNLKNDSELQKKISPKLRGNHNAFVYKFKKSLNIEILQPRIIIRYSSSSPEKAAMIANAFAEELNIYFLEIKNKNYQFLEKQLESSKNDLQQLENQLRQFEEKNEIIALDEQLNQQLVDITQLNMRLNQLRGDAAGLNTTINTSSDPLKMNEAQARLNSVNTEIANIDAKLVEIQSEAEKLPKQKLEYLRLMRDLEKKEIYATSLEQQVLAMKLKTEQNIGKFIVLDPAYPPFSPAPPGRLKMVLIGFAGSLCFALFLSLFIELYNKQLCEYNKNNLV